MKYKKTKGGEIDGHLDVFIVHNEEEDEGVILTWEEVLIHGDPEGLRSFAKLLNEIADLDQNAVLDKHLPLGAREHYHLRPRFELSNSSVQVIVGRLDANGTGTFYDRYLKKGNSN